MNKMGDVFSLFWRKNGSIMDGSVRDNPNKSAEDFILLQFTGLKDKNGKEIYEGDILRLDKDWQGPSSNGMKVGAVKYEDCSFCLELYDSLPLHLLIPAVIEIIGNIYENPELLEKAAAWKRNENLTPSASRLPAGSC